MLFKWTGFELPSTHHHGYSNSVSWDMDYSPTYQNMVLGDKCLFIYK